MSHSKHLFQIACVTLMLAVMAQILCIPAVGDTDAKTPDRRVPYTFFIDDLNGQGSVSSTDRPHVAKGWTLWQGQKLTFSGWLATAEGMSRYQYAFVPEDNSFPVWQDAENTVISPRPDLAPAGIPHETGHGTAGFSFTVTAPRGVDGYFDFYLRGVSGDGVICDMVIILQVAVGNPDRDDGKTHTVNLSRLAAIPGALSGGRFETDGTVTLSGNGLLALGTFDLGLFESMTVKYTASAGFVGMRDGDAAILGIKTAPTGSRAGSRPDPYRMADGRYDMTDSLTFGTVAANGGTLCLDLSAHNGRHDLYLSSYTFGDGICIREITLTYIGAGASRAAVKVFFTADLSDYFYSPNATEMNTVHDNRLGDVMRLSATQATNDAYIHFGFESLLSTKQFALSADEYKFIVVLARTKPGLPNHSMTFYLCPGAIGGPTEACTKTTSLNNDGAWHYYLLDLRDKDTWQGIIHLWRFDMINGNAEQGDYVDFATVQFFRTEEAARKAAAADPNSPDAPFACGTDPLLLDMSEEEALAVGRVDFVPAADRTYLFEEPDTPPTEPVTDTPTEPAVPFVTDASDGSTADTAVADPAVDPSDDTSAEAPTDPAHPRGCASLVSPSLIPLLLCGVAFVYAHKPSCTRVKAGQ